MSAITLEPTGGQPVGGTFRALSAGIRLFEQDHIGNTRIAGFTDEVPPGSGFTFFTPAKDERPQVSPMAWRMGGMGGTPMLLTLRALRSLAVKKRFRALSRIKVAFFQQIVPKALLHCLAVAEMAGESR